MDDMVEVRRVQIEKVRLSVSQVLPNRVEAMVDVMPHMEHAIVAEFQTFIAGMGGEEINIEEQWPDGWWQAVRERWMPLFWLSRHPVRYKHVSCHRRVYEKVCPHMQLPESPSLDQYNCIEFFSSPSL